MHIRPIRFVGPALLSGLLAVLLVIPGAGQQPGKVSETEQEIARVQAQIAELSSKLDDLKKQLEEENTATVVAQDVPEGTLPQSWADQIKWRSIGPATMGGRVIDISVYEAEPSTFYLATASGGVLKTVNNGITFEHQFDKETTVSLGAVAMSQSNKNIVWVGTGEANPRNSVSYGDGVYKSTDGGKTWTNMGLHDSFQIGRIIVHPKNPDIVYVGALGRLYGPNKERGLFKTTDGGQTWDQILFVDENTGVIDMVMHPNDPKTLLVATYERKRDEFDAFLGASPPEGGETYGPIVGHSKKSGIYRTTDGGKSFEKLSDGLPNAKIGRVGLEYYRSNPDIVFAIVDTEHAGKGDAPPNVYMGISGESSNDPKGAKIVRVTEDGPAKEAGIQDGDVIISWDGRPVNDYDQMIYERLHKQKSGDLVKLVVIRGDKKEKVDLSLSVGERPTERGPASLGLRAEPSEEGLKVTEPIADSAAAKAGIRKDDLILEFDGRKVTDLPGFITMIREKKAGDKVSVKVKRGDKEETIEVVLDETPTPGRPTGGRVTSRPFSSGLGGQRENVVQRQGKIGPDTGGVYKSTDGGTTWTRINSINPRPMYFSVVRVDPSDESRMFVLGVRLSRSTDGGRRFGNAPQAGVHADQHALWINPNNGQHMIICTDGGVYMTYDGGQNWDHLNHMAMGQFYHVSVDTKRPYNVYGGLQDNGSWGGPSRTLRPGGGPINEDWIFINGGDGFVTRADPVDPDIVYAESQNGGLMRRDLRTGQGRSIRVPAPQGQRHRFNWNTPYILSHHNPRIIYTAGNIIHRSVDRGDNWKNISPEFTRTKRGSGTALSESPRNPDVLWAGSDDGALWVTRDGGQNWEDVAKNVGLPKPFWVATIEASRFKEGRAYVAFDAHRSDDDNPYVYVTEDFGKTWTSISENLPRGSTRVCREDLRNENLLYVGTEFGCFASTNRGGQWTRINAGTLPTVAVHEFAQPISEDELVVATHGRSLWVADISALRQTTPEVLKSEVTLFKPAKRVRWQQEPGRTSPYSNSARKFKGQNPDGNAVIHYYLAEDVKELKLEIKDYTGRTVATPRASKEAGLRRVTWNMTVPTPRRPGQTRGGTRAANPGVYRVVLTIDGKEYDESLAIEPDPTRPAGEIAVDELAEVDEEEDALIDD